MDVTPQELRSTEIKDSWRGYDRDEVDDLLERAAVTIEGLQHHVQEVAEGPGRPAEAAAQPAVAREDADIIQRTLLLAQRAADEAVAEAQTRARQVVDDAEAKAQALVSDAEATARRLAEGERRRLEAEITELTTRREQVRADADALESYASAYRERLRAALEADLTRLGSGIDAPMARPELHDLPPSPLERAEREPAPSAEPAPEPAPQPVAAGDSEASTAEHHVVDLVDTEPAPQPSGDTGSWNAGTVRVTGATVPAATAAVSVGTAAGAAGERTAPSASEWPPAPAATSPSPSWLAGDDAWRDDQPLDEPAPWERETAAQQSFASDVPMDAHAIDTDALDDDAFFASLRDAVREETPLGPREDHAFFESEPEDTDRRRFRRRR